jgi:mxaJ protein
VAADPNNLPFSNQRLEGFENKIIALLAADLGLGVEYTWHAQRRGFFRETLQEGNCDVVAGVPAGFDAVLSTRPYYVSSYVIVRRRDHAAIHSLDDPALRTLKIGVQLVGDDAAGTPPAAALARRGLIDNVRGYTVYGDYREPNPPARIVAAVASGEIDVALVWGPFAGYFALAHGDQLVVEPLPSSDGPTGEPFTFAISVGVRRSASGLRDALDAALRRRQADIDAILARYGVPRTDIGTRSP